MSRRRGLLGEVSWFQVAASVLAAVTAAWIASRLGVAGTIVGAALGSAVVTITTAVYGRTLDKGATLLVTTSTGTIIQRRVEEDGDIAETMEQAAEVDSPVERAEIVADETKPRLHWKTIAVTTVVVLALALAAISAYELVSGRTLDGSRGTTLGDTFGGRKGKPEPTRSTTTPTPEPTVTPTRTPSPNGSTPTPIASTPTATIPTSPITPPPE